MKLKNIEVRTFKTSRDKKPKTGHGFKDATYEYNPANDDNYGVVTGEVKNENGEEKYLLVIDVDNKEAGMWNWEAYTKMHLLDKELNTYTVSTQSGGLHYYYLTDLVLDMPSTFMKNVDIKYVGGYVVGAGSIGEKGNYTVVNDIEIINLPNAIYKLIKNRMENKTTNKSFEVDYYELTEQDREKIIEGLIEHRDWDTDYNKRYSVLYAMKKTGFDFLDFLDVIAGSKTDKTSKDWKTSWGSSPEAEAEIGDVLLLVKYSKYVPEGLKETDKIFNKKHQKVKTLAEAIKIANNMFSERYQKIRVAPKIYVLDMKQECEILEQTFYSEYSSYSIEVEEQDKTYNPATLYFKYSEPLMGHKFIPNNPNKIVNIDGDMFYNGYKPIKYKTEFNYDLEYCPLVMDYIFDVLASGREDVARIIHTFISKTIFNPTDRVNTFALVMRTVQEGTGKSFFGEFVYNLIGGEKCGAAKISKVKELNNENNVLKNKLFVYIDESANNWDKSDVDMMKDLITGNKFRVKQKYVSNYELENYTHWYFNSNDVNVAPLGLTDRRYMVIKPNTNHTKDKAYFKELDEEINNQQAMENYLGYIYQFKDDVVVLPETEERVQQKMLNVSAEINWLINMVEEESFDWNIYNSKDYFEINGTGAVSNIDFLYKKFQSFVDEEYAGGRKVKNKRAFSAELKEWGFIIDNRRTTRIGEDLKIYYPILTREQLYERLLELVSLEKPENKCIQI